MNCDVCCVIFSYFWMMIWKLILESGPLISADTSDLTFLSATQLLRHTYDVDCSFPFPTYIFENMILQYQDVSEFL